VNRASALLPWNADAAALHAVAAGRVGACEEAVLFEQLAEQLRVERGRREEGRGYSGTLWPAAPSLTAACGVIRASRSPS
jgi:hypothetical protein